MIKLTDETRIVKDSSTLKDKTLIGTEVDDSLYLVRIDKHNLALRRGGNVEGYFGDVRTALKRSLNYAIKGSDEALTLDFILQTVQKLDKRIEELECNEKALDDMVG